MQWKQTFHSAIQPTEQLLNGGYWFISDFNWQSYSTQLKIEKSKILFTEFNLYLTYA